MVHISTLGKTKIESLVASVQELTPDDRRQLVEYINATAKTDMKVAARNRRLGRIVASAADEHMKVALQVAMRGCRRIGVEIEAIAASADPLAMVNKAMGEARMTASERMQLKAVLHNVGALD
jgi:hypothetical protein